MKKWISLILAVCLLASMLALPALAATKEEQNTADALNHLGLFLGTTKGYELDASLTRAQSAMLLVRMLGALKQAETGDYSHPFDDVAPWASRVVAYAYTNNLVKGYNATKYGGEDTVTDFQYLTIVLRVLGYTDSGDKPDFNYRESRKLAKSLGLVDSETDDASFTRGDAVDIFWRALNTSLKNENRTLAERLIEQKVFDAQLFMIASEYAKNGKPASETAESGKTDDTKKDDTKTDDAKKDDAKKDDTKTDEGKKDDTKKDDSGEKKLEDTTWEEYLAMEDKDGFIDKFASLEAFMTWQKKAKAVYDAKQNVVTPGADGSIDIGDLIGKKN